MRAPVGSGGKAPFGIESSNAIENVLAPSLVSEWSNDAPSVHEGGGRTAVSGADISDGGPGSMSARRLEQEENQQGLDFVRRRSVDRSAAARAKHLSREFMRQRNEARRAANARRAVRRQKANTLSAISWQ